MSITRLLSALALSSILVAAPALAQLVPGDEPSTGGLFARLGPSAEVLRNDDGSVRLVYGAHVLLAGEPADRALRFVREHAVELGFSADVELVPGPPLEAHGFTIVRLARWDHGLRVRGAGAVVRFLPDGALELVLVQPGAGSLAEGAALPADRVVAFEAAGGRTVLDTRPELVSLEGALVPVYAIVSTLGPPTTHREAVLDARDGTLLWATPLSVDAMGTVFARNRVSDANVTTDVELTDLTSTTSLTGTYFRAFNCAATASGCAGSQTAPDAAGDFLFPPVTGSYTDAFAEVSAYYHANEIAAYFRDTHGFTWTCAGGTRMDLVVNYTEAPMRPYDNAAFQGGFSSSCGSLIFGQGVTGDFAWDADVVYHEFGHAVTDQVTDLGFFIGDTLGTYYDPLAVNEGASDYWAGVVQGDASIAESFSGGGLGAHGSLRVIDEDLTCPADLLGEGHEDGRILSGMAWQLRAVLGNDIADDLWFTTIATSDDSPSMSEMATLYRATAMGMMAGGMIDAADLTAIDAEIAERGLEACRRIVPLDSGLEHIGYSGQEFVTGGIGRGIAPLHFSLEIPVDAVAATIFLAATTPAGNYRIHLRAGSPVRVASRITSSWAVDMGSSGAVVLDAGSPLVLPRCGTLYAAVEVLDLDSAGQSLFSIQASIERSGDPSAECPVIPDAGVPVADAGAPDAGPAMTASPSSCGCSVHRTAPPIPAFVVLALLVAWRRRRA